MAAAGCSSLGGGQHTVPSASTTADSQTRHAQLVSQNSPECDDAGCWIIPCDLCTVPVPILYDPFYIGRGGGGNGGGGQGGEPPPPSDPVPDLSQPEDSACPGGWNLAFDSVAEGGAPYCEGDGTLTSPVGLPFQLNLFDLIYFNDTHFWDRHLACYIGQKFTLETFKQLVAQDFTIQGIAAHNTPPLGGGKIYVGLSPIADNNNHQTEWGYRVGLRSETFTTREFVVGTAYLVPRRPNCP